MQEAYFQLGWTTWVSFRDRQQNTLSKHSPTPTSHRWGNFPCFPGALIALVHELRYNTREGFTGLLAAPAFLSFGFFGVNKKYGKRREKSELIVGLLETVFNSQK